jgi:hypothetical protein
MFGRNYHLLARSSWMRSIFLHLVLLIGLGITYRIAYLCVTIREENIRGLSAEIFFFFFVKNQDCATVWPKVIVNLQRIRDFMQFFKISGNFFCNPDYNYKRIEGIDSLIFK